MRSKLIMMMAKCLDAALITASDSKYIPISTWSFDSKIKEAQIRIDCRWFLNLFFLFLLLLLLALCLHSLLSVILWCRTHFSLLFWISFWIRWQNDMWNDEIFPFHLLKRNRFFFYFVHWKSYRMTLKWNSTAFNPVYPLFPHSKNHYAVSIFVQKKKNICNYFEKK